MTCISLIIPLKNEARNLPKCVKSLLAQKLTATFEILLIDNDSTDETLSLALELARKNKRVRVFEQKKPGSPCARNFGVSQSRGKILVFTDADCTFPPNWLEKLTLPLRKTRALPVGATSGDTRAWKKQNNFWERYADQTWQEWEKDRFAAFPGFLPWAPTCNLAVRADLFRALGGFDENFTAGYDTDFCWRLVLNGFLLVHTPEALVFHRRRNTRRDFLRQIKMYSFYNRVMLQHYEKLLQLGAAITKRERLEVLLHRARVQLANTRNLESARYRLADILTQFTSARASWKSSRTVAADPALDPSRLGQSPARALLTKPYRALQNQGWCYWKYPADWQKEGDLILFSPRKKNWLRWNPTAWKFWQLKTAGFSQDKIAKTMGQGLDHQEVRKDLKILKSEFIRMGFLS